MTMKVAITEIGSVSPVMTVLRHDPRNRNTMTTVSSAPSMIVVLTLLTDCSTKSAIAHMNFSSMPGGSCLRIFSAAYFSSRPTSTMLASCALNTDTPMAGWPLTRDSDCRSRSASTTVATCDSRIGTPILRATMMRSNCSGDVSRPSTRMIDSDVSLWIVPTGTDTLAVRSACTTVSTESPNAVSLAGSTRTWICRVTLPPRSTRPTPLTRSKPFCTTCSASSVSSRGVLSLPISANEATGWSFSPPARCTTGSFASRGKVARICASLSRTSWIARSMSTS